MQESKRAEGRTDEIEKDQMNKKPESDATSKETLNDLEENEANVGSSSSEVDPGPAPDGARDESNELKDAGPM